jgi:hypothetical protein
MSEEKPRFQITLGRVLLIAALICFFLAAIGFGVPRVEGVPLGLFLWVLSGLV